jgi:hypothetical protein
MAHRYAEIAEAFPEEINGKAFPYFLDWLKYNVVLVEITAYSDDNAYTIFESMNDRGLNLTSTEMLKGYILSRFVETKDREKANRFWKESIQDLHSLYRSRFLGHGYSHIGPDLVGRVAGRSLFLSQLWASCFEGHFTRRPQASMIDLVTRPPT